MEIYIVRKDSGDSIQDLEYLSSREEAERWRKMYLHSLSEYNYTGDKREKYYGRAKKSVYIEQEVLIQKAEDTMWFT